MTEHFNLPEPPQGTIFPEGAQLIFTSIYLTVCLAALLYSLYRLCKHKDCIAVLLFIGGGIAYFQEPIDDILGLLWHPRPGQWVALNTFGEAPLWGLGIYSVFFGTGAYLLYRQALLGISTKQFWTGIVIFFVVDLVCEIPIIQSGMYSYYGLQPFKILGLPLYWLPINTIGPLLTVVVLYHLKSYFTGWRLLLVPLIPITTDAMGSLGSGWPIFSALNAPNTNYFITHLAALISIGIALTIIDISGRLICVPTNSEQGT